MWLDIEILADKYEEEQNFFYQQNLHNMKKNTKGTKTMKAKKVVAKKTTKAKAKKVKAVAKKKSAKVTIVDKIARQYSIITKWSDNLLQDTYSVVYRKKELKRYINEALAQKYIDQEVLLRLAEHSIGTAKVSRKIKKELEQEFA